MQNFAAAMFIVFGLWTRATAVAMVADMAIVILIVHVDDLFSQTPQGGWGIELPMFYFLSALAFTGGGRYVITHNNILS